MTTPTEKIDYSELRKLAENASLKMSVIAFAGPSAAQWAENNGNPNHLHPQHYDLLLKCGARMDSFTRIAISGKEV